jgi:hypothetical protein
VFTPNNYEPEPYRRGSGSLYFYPHKKMWIKT